MMYLRNTVPYFVPLCAHSFTDTDFKGKDLTVNPQYRHEVTFLRSAFHRFVLLHELIDLNKLCTCWFSSYTIVFCH